MSEDMHASATAYAAELLRLVNAAETDDDARNELDNFGLEFYVTGRRGIGGTWDVTGWVYVLGTGGPHFELRSDGYVHGWGWFGSAAVSAPVESAVVDYFNEWAEL